MHLSFIKNHLNMFGITDITTVVMEGHNEFPDRRNVIIEDGRQKAIQAEKHFNICFRRYHINIEIYCL
nr:hypothetical protein [Neobacillus sp. Marseille-Q6967]